MDNNKMCLLVQSGDKSSNIWKYWYNNFKKHSIKIPTVFLSESIPFNKPGVESFTTGNLPWSDNLIEYLLCCKYTYVIFHHEDYFIKGYNHDLIEHLVDACDKYSINLLKCCGWWSGYIDNNNPHKKTDIVINDKSDCGVLWIYNNMAPYLVSHQSSIWRRDFLLSTLIRGESPWSHEIDGSTRLRERNIVLHAFRGIAPIEYDETINRGQVRPNCEHYFKEIIDE